MKSFEECFELASLRDGHYSFKPERHRILYDALAPVFAENPHPVCLELGVCHGRTAVLLMAMGFAYHGIDDFSLEGSVGSLLDFMDENKLYGELILQRTQDAEWYDEVDVLLVDGDHSEFGVPFDCEKYIPFVKPGGIVVFDDYEETGLPRDQDAHWAVAHYANLHTAGWGVILKGDGFLIARKPKE